jgi:PTH2 family peptidyl-tRNA hydrolase
MTDYKQAIMVREDVKMSKGKMIAQACHASLKAYKKAEKGQVDKWESQGEKKIVLYAEESELLERFQQAKSSGTPAALVQDAGKTEVAPGTRTAAAIGPAEKSKVDSVTGDLKLIK